MVALNFTLCGLSWTPWSNGDGGRWTVSDQLFNNYRLAGFRMDFAWLILSTTAFLIIGLFLLPQVKKKRLAGLCVGLCALEVVGFCAFLYASLNVSFLN